jgi:DNA-binding XRE family transcriptional regulator
MPKSRKRAVRVNRPLTAEQQRRVETARASAEADKDAIIARGRKIMRQHALATAALRETFQLLKQERQTQGVTLQELEDRTGISRGALSRLENDPTPNPTVRTLQRIAAALGKSIIVRLGDGGSP